jgi:hypothetical protein
VRTESVEQEGRIHENVRRSQAADAMSLDGRFAVGRAVRVRCREGEHEEGTVTGKHWASIHRMWVVHVRLATGQVLRVDAARVTKAGRARKEAAA